MCVGSSWAREVIGILRQEQLGCGEAGRRGARRSDMKLVFIVNAGQSDIRIQRKIRHHYLIPSTIMVCVRTLASLRV